MLVTCSGILVIDIIAANLPKISDPGELTYAPKGIEEHMGGHAGNVSIDLMKIGFRKGEVSSTASVGVDLFGDFLEKILDKYGIVTHLQRIPDVGTSKDLVLVVKGEDRRFHVDVGANLHLSSEHVLSVLEEEKPIVHYVGGVGLTGRFDDELPGVLEKAKEFGCLTFLDPAKPYKRGWDFLIPSMAWTDVFHCNNDEAKEITGKENPKEAARFIVKKGVGLVIISLGEKGVIARTREDLFKIPAFKVPVIDPTGAGDAMCAGVIRGLLKSKNEKECNLSMFSNDEIVHILLEGAAAGASCVTMVGTTTAVSEENIANILETQADTMLKEHVKVVSCP